MATRMMILGLIFVKGMIFCTPMSHFSGRENIQVISTRETKNCFVTLVKINGIVYLVKQKKDFKKQLAVVRDALSAYIAHDLNNIAHQVVIIPPSKKFPGKIKSDWPATIHTLAPGETVRAQKNSKYNALRLRQFWSGAKNIQEKGLTHAIIGYMTWHRQLPIIIALDLVLGNSDRHCGNLCYDPATDTFCAIDMDDTFNKDLSLFACKKIKMMLEDEKVIFSQEEIEALAIMKNTLTFLTQKHTPKNVIKKLRLLAKKAGFMQGSDMYSIRIERKLRLYENMISQSYKSTQKLITLLAAIIRYKSPEKMLEKGSVNNNVMV